MSVTAEWIFFADTFGSSSRLISPARRRGLAHLRRRILQVVDLRRALDDVRLGHHERLPEPGVEALGQVAGQFEVLTLVLTDRHQLRAVEQDVGGLQDRVGEQADAGVVAPLPWPTCP